MAQVTIYTTPSCGFCKQAKAFFKENNVEYSERDVVVDEAARDEMIQKSGQMGVPVIDIDGNLVIGFNQGKVKELLGM